MANVIKVDFLATTIELTNRPLQSEGVHPLEIIGSLHAVQSIACPSSQQSIMSMEVQTAITVVKGVHRNFVIEACVQCVLIPVRNNTSGSLRTETP